MINILGMTALILMVLVKVVLIAVSMRLCTAKSEIEQSVTQYDDAYESLSLEDKKEVYQFIQKISKKEGEKE